jgi:hypothetical protein
MKLATTTHHTAIRATGHAAAAAQQPQAKARRGSDSKTHWHCPQRGWGELH